MGTVFTIDIRDEGTWDRAVGDVVAWLHRVDRTFSTYRSDSDISRMRRGELRAGDADPDVLTVLDMCATVQEQSGGAFSGLRAGGIDPTGMVKGWAIEQAGAILRRQGCVNHAVNGGGDMQLSGAASRDQPWRVGIADPHRRGHLLSVVTGSDFAVATSGTAERGLHIIDPATAAPVTELASATVLGPSATLADAYATAVFVLGRAGLRWIDGIDGYAAAVVTSCGTVHASTGWPTATHTSPASAA
jgi:thiamine biosynthesis lipoprotein